MLTWNSTVSSSEMAFVSCFSTAGADANNSPTVRITVRSKICFVMAIAPTDSFKTLISQEFFFLSTLFSLVAVSVSSIAVSGEAEEVAIGKEGKRFSLTGSHSPIRTFLGAEYSFSFSIRQRNIHLTISFAGFLAG